MAAARATWHHYHRCPRICARQDRIPHTHTRPHTHARARTHTHTHTHPSASVPVSTSLSFSVTAHTGVDLCCGSTHRACASLTEMRAWELERGIVQIRTPALSAA